MPKRFFYMSFKYTFKRYTSALEKEKPINNPNLILLYQLKMMKRKIQLTTLEEKIFLRQQNIFFSMFKNQLGNFIIKILCWSKKLFSSLQAQCDISKPHFNNKLFFVFSLWIKEFFMTKCVLLTTASVIPRDKMKKQRVNRKDAHHRNIVGTVHGRKLSSSYPISDFPNCCSFRQLFGTSRQNRKWFLAVTNISLQRQSLATWAMQRSEHILPFCFDRY